MADAELGGRLMTGRQPAKILMVDDRPENLLALEAILQGLGHELIKASSGEDALKCLLTTEVAVILLDVQMPGMDGFETAAHIKGRDKTRDIPILFLTAIDGEAHQAFRGYAAGAVDYLAKPFDPWLLKAKVGVFVELYAKRSELAAQADGLRRQLASYDSAGLEELSLQAQAAVERAQELLGVGGPGLAAALEQAAAAALALRQALPSRTAVGQRR
jgi:CheY-like chemotaxis protein